MAKVLVHIGRLSLRGVRPEVSDAVVTALREQLSLEYARPGIVQKWAASGSREHLRARIASSAEPKSLGREAAKAISKADHK
jgi:hypothetical protein